MRMNVCLSLAVFVAFLGSCMKPAIRVLERFSADTLEGVVGRSDVAVDDAVKAEGAASLRIDAKGPRTVQLYEVPMAGVDDARIIYQARVRTQGLDGRAYLEMWCRFPGQGEYYSRALQSPVGGTTEWSSQETPFFLQKGQAPDLVKLNLVVEGKGTVWVDDIRLIQGALG